MSEAKVDFRTAAVARMAKHWPMLQALSGGTAAMRDAATQFLPKWPKEEQDSYSARLQSAVLFPAFSHTVIVDAAKPFARPMKWEEPPPAQIADLLEDVDLQGTELHAFGAALMAQCLQMGLTGVLVDYPKAEGLKTVAEERAAGVRPYFTVYPAPAILGWRVDNGPDGPALSQLRLKEIVVEPDGDWGEVEVEQVRVLMPGVWQIWRKQKDQAGIIDWALHDSGTMSIRRIPFVFFYGLREGFGVGKPPLLDLAFLNVEHWQSASDQQTILHVARVPILFAKGFTESDNLTIGANCAVRSLSTDADLRYVEHSGAAIEAGRQSLLDLEDRMRQAGAELLVQRPSITTATQVQSESEASRSILQTICETFEESLEECVELMGEWIGLEFEAEIDLFKDFGAANLPDKAGDLLLRAAEKGLVSAETVFKGLQRMDVIHQSVNWEEEQGRVKTATAAEDSRALENEKARAEIVPAVAKLKK